MRGAQLLRRARRAKRIAKAQKSGDAPRGKLGIATMLATRPPIDLPPMISGPLVGPRSSMAATYSGMTFSALGVGFRSPLRRAAM